jgi:hypothetical protein
MHPGRLTVPIGTAEALVAEQFPAWAKLPIRAVASQGTVNALFASGTACGPIPAPAGRRR